MKKINFQPSFLQILYLIIFLILFSFVIYIPTLINGPLHIKEKLIFEEQTVEGILLAILFVLSVLMINLYMHEVSLHKEIITKIQKDKKKVETRLNDSDQYIGIVNVQIQEIKSLFNSINEYPETKAELKKTFSFFAERVLGIVNSDWVLIRIIDSKTQRTISEHFGTRFGLSPEYPHVSNEMIIENQPVSTWTSVISNPKNLNVLVFCVMPVDKISNDQRFFIQAIMNEFTKIFVISNSTYYKKESKTVSQDKNLN